MKKTSLFLSVAIALVSFASCQKNELSAPAEGTSFSMFAELTPLSKTTLDGFSVDWENDDAIYVVTSGSNAWASAKTFTYDEGRFNTSATIADGTYSFNAIYCTEALSAGHTSASTIHTLSNVQDQDCAHPTSHVKFYDALAGSFSATLPVSKPVSVTMNHIYTMMQVDLENATGADVELVKYEMTAENAVLAGSFEITDFAAPSIICKSGQTSTISVNLTGAMVKAGENLPVYFVMAPLADYSGAVTMKVTDSEGNVYEKTVNVSGKSFRAGAYNTASFAFDTAQAAGGLTVVNAESPEGVSIAWKTGDLVGIYAEDGAAVSYEVTDISADGKSASVEAEADGKLYAVYPYNEKAVLSGDKVELVLPYSHVADTPGAVTSGTNVRVAVSENGVLNFKNIFGYLKIEVKDADIKEVVVRSLNPKISLAGKSVITVGTEPSLEIADGVPHVLLVPTEGQNVIAPGVYYIPVALGAMDKGFSLRFKKEGKMFVKNVTSATAIARNSVTDLGTLVSSDSSFEEFVEMTIVDKGNQGGFALPDDKEAYHEYGTNTKTAPSGRALVNLNDANLSTYWCMPSGKLNGGTGEAYDINGVKTIRGSYLRLDFNQSGKGPSTTSCVNRVDKVIFEYSNIYDPDNQDITMGHDWMPWTLDVREYNVMQPDGNLKYGTLQNLTVEESALPWTWEYNNLYVSDVVQRSHSVSNYNGPLFNGLILCCTRTRDNDGNELQPKNATSGVTFKNLAVTTPESQWGLSELHVWVHIYK